MIDILVNTHAQWMNRSSNPFEERKGSKANGIELSEADCRGRAKGFEERTRVSGGD